MEQRHQPDKLPTENRVTVGDLTLRCLDWGGDGPLVLALHGLASSAQWYQRVARRLQGSYRVIAPDQRGHGQSTQATSGYDWQTLASDAIGLLDQLGGEQAIVLGHSWGGPACSLRPDYMPRPPRKRRALTDHTSEPDYDD